MYMCNIKLISVVQLIKTFFKLLAQQSTVYYAVSHVTNSLKCPSNSIYNYTCRSVCAGFIACGYVH